MELGFSLHFNRQGMNEPIVIIGGGIAGLSLSIDLRRRGHSVNVLEKGHYPRHKVCGEYISMESHRYLTELCPTLLRLTLPEVTQFKLTAPGDKEFTTPLSLGGIGISRYLLEEMLFKEAQQNGVVFITGTKVLDVQKRSDSIGNCIQTSKGMFPAALVCNASGRQSNMSQDKIRNRNSATNYVGIKYHIKLKRKVSQIEIHNFPGGYCGISAIEDDKSCLCYIVNSKKLNQVNNSIPELERTFLFQNRHLEDIFTRAEFCFKEPITVSGIHFRIKAPATDLSFFLGDSAGSMAPITGNGMSMGLRSANFLAEQIDNHFKQEMPLCKLRETYSHFWNNEYSSRIKLSRYLQKLSESTFLARKAIDLFNLCPILAKGIIKQTHGSLF